MSRERLVRSVDLARLIWVGPITVLLSLAAVLMVRFIAVAVLQPDPTFFPLTVLPAVVDTTVLVALAVFVFRQVVADGNLSGPLLGEVSWKTLRLLSSGLSFSWDPQYGAAFSFTSCALRTNSPNSCSEVSSSRIVHLRPLTGNRHVRSLVMGPGLELVRQPGFLDSAVGQWSASRPCDGAR